MPNARVKVLYIVRPITFEDALAMKIFLVLLTLHVLKVSTQAIIFPSSPPSTSSTFSHFSLYKNSALNSNCSFHVEFLNQTHNQSVIQTAYAKTQSDFCAHLNPAVNWYIVPTNPTSAAFLPSWSSATFDLVNLVFTATYSIFKFGSPKDSNENFSLSKLLFVIYNICQFSFWWYSVISGFVNPLHASWVSPIGWLLPAVLAGPFIKYFQANIAQWDGLEDMVGSSELWGDISGADNRGSWRFRMKLLVLVTMLTVLAAQIASGIYVGVRISPQGIPRLENLGAGSYTPLDSFPVSNFSTFCQQALRDPSSHIYTDPSWIIAAKLHLAMFWIAFSGMLFYAICPHNRGSMGRLVKNILFAFLTGIFLDLVVIITMCLTANRGTPFNFLEECQAVVIAMSPKFGYWDAEFDEAGYKLQIVRAVFGL